MHATVFPGRIDIVGDLLSQELWKRLLDELKAEGVSSATQTGKRMSGTTSAMRPVSFIYRSTPMPDEEVIRILGRYGIQTSVATQ